MVNWDAYLESICQKYAQWWDVYTLTDVEGCQQAEAAPSLLLDFNLMVQTVQPPKEEREQQKTERLSVLEGLRKYAPDHVLLVGRPGSGKSTALARLLLEEAQKAQQAQQTKIPVLVELRYYRTSVLELVQEFLQRHDPSLELDSEKLKTWLRQGQLQLLLDGLNELPSQQARRDLKAFRENYQKTTPMVFTTRDLGLGGDLDIDKKLQMQPLTESQMRDFVKKYLPEQGEQMLRQLGKRLQELGQTPLLLMMLCSLFKATGKVPPNLGLMLREFTRIYEGKLKQDVLATEQSSRQWWRSLLEHLAWRMTQGQNLTELQVAIAKQEAENILAAFLDAEKFDRPRDRALCWLQDLLNHHLIQLTAADHIEFPHQLIQEYYTAESLLKQLPHLSDETLKRDYLNYLKWTEPLALMLALVEDVAQVVRVVQLALEVDWQLGAKLAGAVKPEFQSQTVSLVGRLEVPLLVKIKLWSVTLSEKSLSELTKALKDEDSSIRSSVAEALGNIGSSKAVELLMEALKDEDSSVRYRAVNMLGKIGSYKAVEQLIGSLKDEDSSVRYRVAEVLGEIGSDNTAELLMEALKDEDSSVRYRAVDALGKIGSSKAVEQLIGSLKDEDSSVRYRAAEALGKIGSSKAVEQLIGSLKDEKLAVRYCAINALGKIGSSKAVEQLIEVLKDKDSSVRYLAADALGKIARPEIINQLFKIIKSQQDTNIVNTIAAIQYRCRFYNYLLTVSEPQSKQTLENKTLSSVVRPILLRPMYLLHLSDLHFGTTADATRWHSQLADDLRQLLSQLEPSKPPHLDALIISGDVANKSLPSEYEAAELFINRLYPDFGLKRSQIIIVPGNHDLNWEISDSAYKPVKRKDYLNSLDDVHILENDLIIDGNYVLVPDATEYQQRFKHFSQFYEKVIGKPYPQQYRSQYDLRHFPEQDLLVLALNSAWKLNHDKNYKSLATINPDAVTNALNEINDTPTYRNSRLKIAVWHHPLNSPFEDRIKEHDFMQRVAGNGFRLALHGHIHQAGADDYKYRRGSQIDIIAAGTFGAPVREWVPGYPLQYNLLSWQGNKLRVYTRKRIALNGAWQPDAMWVQENGIDATSSYEIELFKESSSRP